MDKDNLSDSPDIFDDLEESMEVDPFSEEKPEAHHSRKGNDSSSESWRGAHVDEIRGCSVNSRLDTAEFPAITPAYNHTVLFHVFKYKPSVSLSSCPVPQQGKDVWSKDYVRMPCSPQSLYPVEIEGRPVLQNRWDLITNSLSKSINNSYELEKAILEYNSKYRGVWKFIALHKLFNEHLEEEETDYFFKNTLPSMIDLALKLPQIVPGPIPLLRQHHNRSVSLSQQQVACLLANAFFCTFPRRNSRKPKAEYYTYPDINFNGLFRCSGSKNILEKLKCICNYFRRVCNKVSYGVLTFTRNSVEISKCPNWSKSNLNIGSVPLHVDAEGTIEDNGVGLLQVDFANKYLGGGVLGYGCVQEEIRFVICPELMISMLFTEALKPDEALLMIGCERYNDYKGYADSFIWSGNHIDKTERDSCGRLKCAVVAIDALHFTNPNFQYKPEYIARELKKAWVGFSVCSDENRCESLYPGVATGNWGCGAFGGSPYIKSLLQLMACCVSRRSMAYYTFGDVDLRDDIINMYNFLSANNVTVAELYKYLCEFHKSSINGNQLYPFILQSCKDSQKREQRLSSIVVQPKMFYTEKQRPSVSASLKLEENIPKSEIENIFQSDVNEKESKVNEKESNESESVMRKSDTCDQQSSGKSFFDTVINADSASSSKRESPAKKNVLSFFDKNSVKCSKVDTENKMDISEGIIQIHSKEKIEKIDLKIENETSKKSGKISDYFQRLQKH